MKTSIAGLRLRCACVLVLVTASCCFVSSPRAMLGVESAPPGGLAEINTECRDAATLALMEARKMRAAVGVAALWDLMTRLSASPQPRHQDMFVKLAQAFWERYVDCVMSHAHGLGRRRSGVSAGDHQLSL